MCLQCGRPGFNPWLGQIPWRRKWQPTPVFLPGKSHGWRSLEGYSPWGHKESDMAERLHFLSFLSFSCDHLPRGLSPQISFQFSGPRDCHYLPCSQGSWWWPLMGVGKWRTIPAERSHMAGHSQAGGSLCKDWTMGFLGIAAASGSWLGGRWPAFQFPIAALARCPDASANFT